MAHFSRESEWRIKLPKSDISEPQISTRISVRLEALRNKQHAVLKKLKFMKKARRKFSFSDVVLKTGLTDRQPDKELLLHLFSEKKRLLEKCFFAEVATEKCQVMTEFYSDCNDRLIDIMDQTSHMSSNPEAEQLLQSFHDDITGRLEEARKKLLVQRKAVNKKSKDVGELEFEMNQTKMEMSKGLLLLKEKLSKGVILDDQEILQLSLGTCLDTNMKLATAVQSHGQQSDELQERFIWKRDEFVTQLAKDHQQTLLRIFVPKMVGPSLSSPERRSPCNKGKTMRDFEEELSSLRKENFDLKMRVYVLNEQMELFQNIDNADQLYEVNTNLKKEVEKLKAELEDKEDLVLKAGEAMNILSAKHIDEISSLRMELEEKYSAVQEENQKLKREVQALIERSKRNSPETSLDMQQSDSLYSMACTRLPSETLNFMKSLEVEVLRLRDELDKTHEVLDNKEALIQQNSKTIAECDRRCKELQTEMTAKSSLLEGAYKDLREKENMYVQMCKKAGALEDRVNLKQLEVDNLQKALATKPAQEDMRDIRNKCECLTTENNILVNKITELTLKLEAEEVKNSKELLQEKAPCSSCRQRANTEECLRQAREQLQQRNEELQEQRKDHLNTVKALKGCIKANEALTRDIESLNKKIVSAGLPDAKESLLKIRELSDRVAYLQLEKETAVSNMEGSLNMLRQELKEKENRIEELERKCAECSNSKIEELESQVSMLKLEMESMSSSEAATEADKKQLQSEVEAKKKEIDLLNEELRKRTFNLQELVNKELWDKNREIEKLNKACERKQQEVVSLKERLTSQEYELHTLNDKLQELSVQVNNTALISELKYKLTEEIEKRVKLESDADMWKKTAEESEKTRKELMNACCLFKARLEELATFLESILPCLGSKRRKILQDAIDRSREASRTLSQSVMNDNVENTLTVPILPDISQVDFCSDNDIDVTVDDTNKSCLQMQNEEVANLKAKMESVVQKLDEVRGIEKTKKCWKINNYEDRFDFVKLANMSSSFNIEEVSEVSPPESFTDSTLPPVRQPSQPRPVPEQPLVEKCQSRAVTLSESEGWSEPDRDVSLARIGLRDSSVPVGRLSTEESSDNSCKAAVCKRRCEAAEIRRLSLKVRSLERVIHNLKNDRTSSARSPSREISPVGAGDAPDKFINAVDDLKKEKDKLEASLKSNKDILNQLTVTYKDEPPNREVLKAVHMIAHQFEQLYVFFTEMEDHYLVIEEEKEAVHQALAEKERKIESLNAEVASLRAELKEKENEILEKQCALLEMKNEYILMENKCKIMETGIEEMSKWKSVVQKSEEDLEALKDSHLKEINNLKNKLKRAKEERDAEVNELKSSLDRAFKRIDDVCLKKVLLETEFKQKVDSLQKEKRVEVEQEVVKRLEAERKLVEAYETQSELRKRLDEEISKSKDVETAQKSSERWWRRRTEEVESTCADREAELRRRLDNATIATSQAVLERTRLANEKIRLQCELRRRENSAHDMRAELEQRVLELEDANKELVRELKALRGSQHLSDVESPPPFARQRSNATSDYTSDPDQHDLRVSNNNWFPVCGRSNNNCSPDLGIESDQGRPSSLDPPIGSPKTYGGMEREITYLKRELAKKTKMLEDAHRSDKTMKEQLEYKIYSELGKTHELLAKTGRNFKKAQI